MNLFFSSYCDGKQVTCSGLKQWGSYDLAIQGYNALEILKYYYGDNIELKNAVISQTNVSIYPGTPLSLGDQGNDVYQMQYYLNRIAIDYPNIIKIYPANGIFTYRMKESVKQFQEQFNLTVDGIIGKATWYSIAYIFYSVTRLAQIESEGLKQGNALIQYPGMPLRKGSRGENVFKLQYLLFVLSYFNQQLLPVDVDSYFGNNTYEAVINFQNYYGLTSDGIVGKETWNAIVGMYNDIADLIPTFTHTVPYPGSPLKEGSKGEYVEILQSYLNYISAFYSTIHIVEVDKIYGPETKKNVQAFQKLFSLPVTGIVNEETWDTIMNTYRLLSGVILYPNIELKRGSTSKFVSYLQLYLNDIASIDSSLPLLVVDGIYGIQTENSVKKFQQMHNLTPTGSVDSITWNTILKVYLEDVRSLATLDTMLLQDIQPAYLYR